MNHFSFAVEQYNKKGESHIFFKEVFSGSEYFKPGEFLLPPQVRDKYYGIELKAINCSQSGAMGNYTACVVHLVNITDPTTGLSYILNRFYRSGTVAEPPCGFLH
jgi:hypothetical protein